MDYEQIDPGKRLAQQAAAGTASHLARHGVREVPGTRGESAYVVDAGDHYLASLTEGLGTKSLVADAVYRLSGRSHYDLVARDTVATILNDLATVGAAPLVVSAYWAAGDSEWCDHNTEVGAAERAADLGKSLAVGAVEDGEAHRGHPELV